MFEIIRNGTVFLSELLAIIQNRKRLSYQNEGRPLECLPDV